MLYQFCNGVSVSTYVLSISILPLYYLVFTTLLDWLYFSICYLEIETKYGFDFQMMFYSSPQVCSRIAAQRATNPHLDKLYITKDSSSMGLVDQLFMDTAVYSRNRCFRLAFSSKSGKKSFLVPTGRFKCQEMVSPWSYGLFFYTKWTCWSVLKVNSSCLETINIWMLLCGLFS